MDLGIRDRIAIVAASSRGLGREAATALAAEGARLAICARGEDRLKKTAEEIRRTYGVEVIHRTVDVSVREEVEDFVREVIDGMGTVHILVTNAGGPPPGTFLDHEPGTWEKAFGLNFLSAVNLCRATLPAMVKNNWGRIVMMTSIAVKQPIDGLILSNAVRAGVTGLARTLANEFGPQGILVNTVCPGYFLTDRVKSLAETIAGKGGGSAEDVIERWGKSSPIGRIGSPSEFGPLVAFLCSERAGYITGTSIAIDGGFCRSLL